ncbi:hypothetical protein [Sphingobacterium sp. LRF_L2]|uniref:hypothetical protein n=1 Tax=Sphingobacterium sp. LRF_L2 TaxID=3369421 RepID=UPI003F609B73
MFTKLIEIDNKKIGTVHFYAFVIKIERDEVGFALFMNEISTPLLHFRKDGDTNVNFKIDNEQFLWIVKNSKFSITERKSLYAEFEFFLRAMEQRATAYLFKNAKVAYVSNSHDLIRYKHYYISSNMELVEKQ